MLSELEKSAVDSLFFLRAEKYVLSELEKSAVDSLFFLRAEKCMLSELEKSAVSRRRMLKCASLLRFLAVFQTSYYKILCIFRCHLESEASLSIGDLSS